MNKNTSGMVWQNRLDNIALPCRESTPPWLNFSAERCPTVGSGACPRNLEELREQSEVRGHQR
jgi:hypothetical protein